MKLWFSRERIDKQGELEYYCSMWKNAYLQNMWSHTPELEEGPFLAWKNENKSYEEIATLENQNLLLGIAKENPYWYATLEQCMHAVTPYLFLPVEEEKYFDTLVAKIREYQRTVYTYSKDPEGKVIFVKPYNHHSIHDKINELLQWHPLRQKYWYYANSMVLSRKQSKTKERARNNIRDFLIKWATEKIWNNWKRYHKADIIHMTQTKISDVFAVPGSLELDTNPADLKKYPPKPSAFLTPRKPKKKFDKKSLASLFYQTWDAELDNLLHDWREYVEDASFFKPQLKPWQILLRKRMEDNDFSEPYMCEFKVMKPKYLQKHFPDIN